MLRQLELEERMNGTNFSGYVDENYPSLGESFGDRVVGSPLDAGEIIDFIKFITEKGPLGTMSK